MLLPLRPHMHVKLWEKYRINCWNPNKNDTLKIKRHVPSIWHAVSKFFQVFSLSFQMLPGFVTAEKFSRYADRVQENERVVPHMPN